ncbi:hypothetical protein L1049_020691 [Liquidambar formosana]|uniref:Uncharacterized protein n=1 Tax=Liquidambar formosana TaxID=63359 RepID=A0AAP0SD36_LIQFO
MKRVIKTEGGHSCCSAEKQQALGDAMSGPLFFEDGSQKACEALMPGSNESESADLNPVV